MVPFSGIFGKEGVLYEGVSCQGIAHSQGRFGVWGLAQVRTLLAALPQPAWEAVAGAQHMVTASSILALAHLVAVNPKESVWTS